MVPAIVRASVPNTPFVTAAEAGLSKTLRHTDKNNFNPRIGFAWTPSESGARDPRRVRRLHSAPVWIGELLDGGHGDSGRTGVLEQPDEPIRLPEHLVGLVGPGRGCRRARSTSAAPIRSTCAIRRRCSWSATVERTSAGRWASA
jgi:hypothetical protein